MGPHGLRTFWLVLFLTWMRLFGLIVVQSSDGPNRPCRTRVFGSIRQTFAASGWGIDAAQSEPLVSWFTVVYRRALMLFSTCTSRSLLGANMSVERPSTNTTITS